VTLITSSKAYQLQLIEGKLAEHGIHSVIMNKIDSSYLQFGEAQLKVKSTDLKKAQEILSKNEE
jgi:hypothetical protein